MAKQQNFPTTINRKQIAIYIFNLRYVPIIYDKIS